MKSVFTLLTVIFLLTVNVHYSALSDDKAKAQQFLKSQEIEFIENWGQFVDSTGKHARDILYVADIQGKKMYVRKSGISYVISKYEKRNKKIEDLNTKSENRNTKSEKQPPAPFFKGEFSNNEQRTTNSDLRTTDNGQRTTVRIDMDILGMNPDVKIRPEEKLEYYTNYYLAQCPDGITHVPTYKKIVYENAYDNIDLVLYENKGDAEYDFVVKPGADPTKIKLDIKSADRVSVDGEGNLVIESALGKIQHIKPYSYQVIDSQKKEVTSSFNLSADGKVCFEVKNYDRSKKLVIDPLVRLWGTYFEGGALTNILDMINDEEDNLYIVGRTSCFTEISTPGAHDEYKDSNKIDGVYNMDGFIVKFDSTGNRIWGTYYGGSLEDAITSVDCKNKNIYICGYTKSHDAIAIPGTYRSAKIISFAETFIARFNTDGIRSWGTYYGQDNVNDSIKKYEHTWPLPYLKCDNKENIYIGFTNSYFPDISTPGCFKDKLENVDICIAKFDSTGNIIWGTFFGGPEREELGCLDLDCSGNIIFVGSTYSHSGIASPGACQDSVSAVFLAKFDTSGHRIWSTYALNRTISNAIGAITHDALDNIYISGWIDSNAAKISTPGSFQESFGGGRFDYYLAKYNSSGCKIWVTYIGGEEDEKVLLIYNQNLCMINNSFICFAGSTSSKTQISSKPSYQEEINNNTYSSFINIFSSDCKKIYGSYYSGNGGTNGNLLLTNNNDIYLCGVTVGDSGIATPGTFKSEFNHLRTNQDFIVKFTFLPYSYINKFCNISLSTTACIGNSKENDSAFIQNEGMYPLTVNFNSAYFANKTPGLSLISPKNEITLEAGEKENLNIRYTYTSKAKGIIRDTLLIPHNAENTELNPWKVFIEIKIDTFGLQVYDNDLTNQLDSMVMGTSCPDELIYKLIQVKNVSVNNATLHCSFKNSDHFSIAGKYLDSLIPNDYSSINIKYVSDKTGRFSEYLYFYIAECPGFIDSVLVTGETTKTNLSMMGSADFGSVKLGQSKTIELKLKNEGPAGAYIEEPPVLPAPFKIIDITPPIPVYLNPGDFISLTIEYKPLNEKKDSCTLLLSSVVTKDNKFMTCYDTTGTILTGAGSSSDIDISKTKMDFSALVPCQSRSDTLIISNNGSTDVFIKENAFISGINSSDFTITRQPDVPISLKKNDKAVYIVEFTLKDNIPGTKSADLIIKTEDSKYPTIKIPLSGEFAITDLLINPANLDFGSTSVSQPVNAPIYLKNNSKLDLQIKGFEIDDPDIVISPQSYTLKYDESKSFDAAWTPSKPGTMTASIKIIIDQPCPDTMNITAKGTAKVGALSLTTNLNFGTLAFCEEKTDSVVIVNTGETAVEIKEMAKSGTDASLFDFTDNVTLPKSLNKDEKLVRIIKYDGSSSTDGIKAAEIITKAVINGEDKEYRTEIRAERASIIISSAPAALNFPGTRPGEKAPAKLNIRNDSKLAVTITEIKARTYPAVYNIVPNNNVALASQEQKDIDVEFAPVSEGDYKDSLVFKIKINGCDGEYSISIDGRCVKDKDTVIVQPEYIGSTAYLPDTSAWVGDKDFGIPLMIKLDKDTVIKDLSYTAKIRFSATTYEPVSAVDAIFVNNKIVSGERVVELQGTKTISKTDTILGEMRGNIYLGLNDRTDLILDDIKLSDSLIKVTKLNGELRVKGLCQQNLSKIKMMNELVLSVVPSPASDESEIVITGDAKGVMLVAIYSIEGIKKGTIEINKTGFEARQRLNLKDYSSGVYQLIFQSGGECLNVPMVVIK